jgi:hypothetical protein
MRAGRAYLQANLYFFFALASLALARSNATSACWCAAPVVLLARFEIHSSPWS